MLRLDSQGIPDAAIVNRLLAQREQLIGALLIGNNVATIAGSTLATGLFLNWFGDVGVAYATVVMTVLVAVFCEILPKTVAINAPDRFSLFVARPMLGVVNLLGPILYGIGRFVPMCETGREKLFTMQRSPNRAEGAPGDQKNWEGAAKSGMADSSESREDGEAHAKTQRDTCRTAGHCALPI